ncbi:DUF2909 family protein [Crenothrix polyspora]|jgi:branched-subunit amino acid transport protein AzlD|uniref:Transmembrane protein n=1 Tax=Crenothrix polyspora TaxID=360316 RepID=A0A1R4HBW1_9GAMM|nr:DUF2909 family protein [Crenothrix polyspora]SJM93742.1 conserved hypothetical protein [Crenothrix polyspora]
MKIIVIIAFVVIVASLARALFYLIKHKSSVDSEKIMQALTLRSGISILLFVLLFLAVASGLVQPHGLGMQMHKPDAASSQSKQ